MLETKNDLTYKTETRDWRWYEKSTPTALGLIALFVYYTDLGKDDISRAGQGFTALFEVSNTLCLFVGVCFLILGNLYLLVTRPLVKQIRSKVEIEQRNKTFFENMSASEKTKFKLSIFITSTILVIGGGIPLTLCILGVMKVHYALISCFLSLIIADFTCSSADATINESKMYSEYGVN